jgi:RNA polymerase sigma-70 factor, ECF subfamily
MAMTSDGRRNEDTAEVNPATADDRIAGRRSPRAAAGMSAERPGTAVVEQEILACLPHLRAFARSLAGDRDRADDLVQDAILRALGAADQFEPGSNFKAWIFTILRNLYFNEFRRNPSLFRPLEAADMEIHATSPAQHAGLEFDDFRRAFNKLPPEQREALVLVGADGFKYEEAAAICGCAVGTIKSRVSRARRDLQALLGEAGPSEAGEGAQGEEEEESEPAKK